MHMYIYIRIIYNLEKRNRNSSTRKSENRYLVRESDSAALRHTIAVA